MERERRESGRGGLMPSKLASALAAAAAAVGLALCLAPAAGAQELVTIETPSGFVDPSDQRFADPVTPEMPPHPRKLQANVLLPDGYTPSKRYPLLLLLHGAGERWDSWQDPKLGNVRELAKGLDAVVVMPEGALGFYANWWNGGALGSPAWESYIREELLPAVERRFSIRPERRYHAVAGFSMGGYGTYLTASQLPGYFGTVVPMSAFASIRTPETQLAFQVASGGVPFDTIYGPKDDFYAFAHDPLALARAGNYAHSRMDVYTGDGLPDPAVRPPQPDDTVSLVLESFLKLQNDSVVEALRARDSEPVDYTVHRGSHDWEFWRLDLARAIDKGLFNPVPEDPHSWSYLTASTEGQAWDVAFRFDSRPTQAMTFEHDGGLLSVSGAQPGGPGVSLSLGNGCQVSGQLPLTTRVDGPPCRRLKAKLSSRKLKRGKAKRIKVTVTGKGDFGESGPVDLATVRLGKAKAATDQRGIAVLEARTAKRKGKVTLTVSKPGHDPAKVKLRVVPPKKASRK